MRGEVMPTMPTVGARLVQDALGGKHLPAFVPGEPAQLTAAMAAHRVAPAFLDKLAETYDVTEWTIDTFRQAFLEGALTEWHGDARVDDEAGQLRLVSPTCPIMGKARKDPRACMMCQAFQSSVARNALPQQFEDVSFDELLTKGSEKCSVKFRFRAQPTSP